MQRPGSISSSASDRPQPRAGLDYLPSIAVLAFAVPADEIVKRYFADGIASEIIDALGRLHELIVIAASSSLRLTGLPADVRRAGVEFGVRYVLTGEIDRIDQLLHLSYRLIETGSGDVVSSGVVEANIDRLFELQREIVARVVNDLVPKIRDAEIERVTRRPPDNLTAYDLVLQALPIIQRLDQSRFAEGIELLQRARTLDPAFAMPYAWGARMHSLTIGQGWSTDRASDGAQAMRLATQAIELDPFNSLALATAGHLHSFLKREFDTALALHERAVSASPNDPLAWSLSSATLTYCGRASEARQQAELAVRLSPLDHAAHYLFAFAALAAYAAGEYDDALTWCRRSLAENPRYTMSHKLLTVCLVGLGRMAEAREAAATLRHLEPTITAIGGQTVFRVRELHDRYLGHLAAVGLIDPQPRR